MKKITSPTLIEMQTWMKSILTNPCGVKDALIESDKWLNFINSDETSSSARLDIYAEAYYSRILEGFNIDFPITAFILGEDQFAKLVAEYLKLYPSDETNLNNISKSVVPFINNYSNSSAICDIVMLERLALESFFSPIDPAFNPQTLSELKESDWEKIKFRLNSSLKFITSSWPLEEIWDHRHEMKSITLKEKVEKGHYLIERHSHQIILSKLSKNQFFILKKISEGALLSSIGKSDLNSSEEEITTLFAGWIQKSYFSNYYF